MSNGKLTQQVDAYIQWKHHLIKQLSIYRSWMRSNKLSNPEIEGKLERAAKVLRQDEITLAFVGEFSRGKTELINALFFSQYGQRMLPSQAGRTTMCPTEMFYQRGSDRCFIRLLPIETRMASTSISGFKRIPEHWVTIFFDSNDPQAMSQAFAEVARTKEVSVEKARQLGFDAAALEHCEHDRSQVIIPAWRHAMINYDHPLLSQGIRILDTPGLNALGSEPELTLNMLPNSQAIIYLLSADTGVTASDMQVWERHVRQLDEDTQGSLYAVLNKIDILWDDLQGPEFTRQSIEQIRDASAKQLRIDNQDVMTLSAKQALIAKVKKDEALLERSQIEQLETLLCERLILKKEQLVENTVVKQMLHLIQNSRHALNHHLEQSRDRQLQLQSNKSENNHVIYDLQDEAHKKYEQHQKRLIGMRANRRLLLRQQLMLQQECNHQRYQDRIDELHREMSGSWTTLGMNQSIESLFRELYLDLNNLQNECLLADKMVDSIYNRFCAEHPGTFMEAPCLNVTQYTRELRVIQRKSDRFRSQLKTMLTEQGVVVSRYFATLVSEVNVLFKKLHKQIDHWTDDVMLPLMQNMLEQKQLLEQQMIRLKSLTQETRNHQQQVEKLDTMIESQESQLQVLESVLKEFRKPPPFLRTQKVVNLQGQSVA
ncbi:dynamin family protein [Aestuariirhabdus sp. Z084]|uniref:dynamin family protein n=1 Tax=Aestuariirhabdus haliotis TaxID=2918751 RepID=UPI00201B3E16|nr:dynamin family protein [Aestuariirhabdus haliotis]MCL6414148.1 dynamin family protein [Aestuariirhabdus haliotis]MCL6418080.1 dynamin family protein [Aestuariirhabdus haliotis]